ncbi:MAG: hypothetical protein EP343_21775 [Deltaproteobacteria bacterium]|nr:MAG: hypothetical protein EP343_21775 [Deltaproteobacteria bacterium]
MKRMHVWIAVTALCMLWGWNVTGCGNAPAGTEPGTESAGEAGVTEATAEGTSQEQVAQEASAEKPQGQESSGVEPVEESAPEASLEPSTPEVEPVTEEATPETPPSETVAEVTPEAGPESKPEAKPEPTAEVGPEPQPDTSGLNTCTDVKDAYNKAVQQTQCTEASDCQVLTGYCSVGLGGCWHVVSSKLSQADLKALLGRWQSLSCNGPVCSCTPPPADVTCVNNLCVPGKPNSCDSVRNAYNSLVQNNRSCQADSECHILTGHCGVGLGGCYYATNVNLKQSQLDQLRTQWSNQQCSGPVCRCAAPPQGAKCSSGVCVTN